MKYKIIYHSGELIDIKTKVDAGSASVSSGFLSIESKNSISIPLSSIKNIELFRMHGLGRMIKMIHTNGTLFLSVVRLNILGYFVVVNFLKTGKLFDLLKSQKEKGIGE